MAPAPRLSLRVVASPAGIKQAAAALEEFLAGHDVGGAAAWPLHVTLDEILSNIVRHARTGPEAAGVDVTIDVQDEAVEMTVADDGPAFDPLQLPEPDLTAPLEVRRPGGLGVHLVRKLMDRVEYSRAGGRNRLVVTWRPPQEAPRGA